MILKIKIFWPIVAKVHAARYGGCGKDPPEGRGDPAVQAKGGGKKPTIHRESILRI
jgi:hypothetical protein